MATKPPERQQGTKLPKKEMAIKKKLLLVSAVKQSQRRSLNAEDIRVLHVDFRVPASGLLNASQMRGDHDNGARALLSHDRDDVLAGHDGAAQVDGTDAVESLFGEVEQWRIAAGDADADIVMQNVDAAPALVRRRYGGGKRRFLSDVGLEGDEFAAPLLDHRHRFLGRGEVSVDGHDLRTFLRESEHGGTAIAHPFARALAGANNDGSFSF